MHAHMHVWSRATGDVGIFLSFSFFVVVVVVVFSSSHVKRKTAEREEEEENEKESNKTRGRTLMNNVPPLLDWSNLL